MTSGVISKQVGRRADFVRCCLFALAALFFATEVAMADPANLLNAANRGDAITVIAEIDAGTPLEIRSTKGETALLLATHGNHIDAARALIEAGADVNAKDAIHDSPYLYAGARGHDEILALTLSHGADLTSTNRFGGTALIPAAERGHVETVRMLIKAGVDVNHVNDLGWTALIEAVILANGGVHYQQIVRDLLAAGADPNIADSDGVTPLAHAKRMGFDQMAVILQEGGGR